MEPFLFVVTHSVLVTAIPDYYHSKHFDLDEGEMNGNDAVEYLSYQAETFGLSYYLTMKNYSWHQ